MQDGILRKKGRCGSAAKQPPSLSGGQSALGASGAFGGLPRRCQHRQSHPASWAAVVWGQLQRIPEDLQETQNVAPEPFRTVLNRSKPNNGCSAVAPQAPPRGPLRDWGQSAARQSPCSGSNLTGGLEILLAASESVSLRARPASPFTGTQGHYYFS